MIWKSPDYRYIQIKEMRFNFKIGTTIILLSIILTGAVSAAGVTPADPYTSAYTPNFIPTVVDTIPLKERFGDYISDDTYNPFDIMPSGIEQKVEYDIEADNYVVYEKLGDEYYRTPTTMTFEEYLDWRGKQQEREYFDRLAGMDTKYSTGGGKIDPISKINLEKNLIDRLFGGNGVTITPQGNIDLTLGLDGSVQENPNIPIRQRRIGPLLDFDMDIKMNVDGKIGDKMDLGFNYDTNASFDFDQKMKLAYDSEEWTEDDIIKKIEAGNVSFPLRSSLIQGAQSLFGFKTELQFGHLRLTGILSQQRSKQETLSVQNGATVQEFELRPQDYDENRHFFISHYHRDVYEQALSNLPYIQNSLRVTNIEVWVSDDRSNYQANQTMILAVADIGEADPENWGSANNEMLRPATSMSVIDLTTDQVNFDANGNKLRLPENSVNTLFQNIKDNPALQRINTEVDRKCVSATATLKGSTFKQIEGSDFKIFRGRKLSANEYTFNPELGFVSLNVKMRPNQVLSVSYEYFYTLTCDDEANPDHLLKVGGTTDESSIPNTNEQGEIQAEGLILTKLLKGPDQDVNHPTWDLMMKNVYPLRTSQLEQEGFEFDVFYENDRDQGALVKYIPEPETRTIPILQLLGLDQLNSRNDPQPDGKFDFVPGVTVIPNTGSIIFPRLEPFGSALDILDVLLSVDRANFYKYDTLYTQSIFEAEKNQVKNKFIMKGRVKSSSTSEYSLGAWNIPQGSVSVRAGSRVLTEGLDYEVDYGIGRVRILDPSIIQQGVPVDISFEDNSVFSLQQKSMVGLRAEYELNENFYVGGTYLRLSERPFTQKVNVGDDPIFNRIFGLDMNYGAESPFITKMVDKLPFISTNAPSSINFMAEVAALKPGHKSVVNLPNEDKGVVSIDDFEGAVSGLPLSSQPNRWVLSSIPRYDNEDRRDLEPTNLWRESMSSGTEQGANRARLNWYVIEQFVNLPSTQTQSNPYTRRVNQSELFDRDIPAGQLPNLFTFDMSYYPEERGPYNFDPPDGTDYSAGIYHDDLSETMKLNAPEERWGGIMRYMNNSDFQALNYEFIEFWLLNPYMERPDGTIPALDDDGFITIHLGNVSEDIIPDNKQFFENTIPTEGENLIPVETDWGRVILDIPNNDAFEQTNFDIQDVGYDGITDGQESLLHENYLTAISNAGPSPRSLEIDPAADNFLYFNDESFTDNDDVLARYKFFNNPQGNTPDLSDAENTFQRGNPVPDKEDLNNNKSLDEDEKFYEYRIPINNTSPGGIGEIDILNSQYVTDVTDVTPTFTGSDGEVQQGTPEKWYRFRVPINDGKPINNIEGFRSIQFMRVLVNGFSSAKTFRMAEFELVRNQWRKLEPDCESADGNADSEFFIDVVGRQENTNKIPFGYVTPAGIKEERLFTSFSEIRQDENAMSLNYCDMAPGCENSILKLTEVDLRVFERMQLFVHAEREELLDPNLDNGESSVFIRIGKDNERNYYEYEIPLTLSEQVDTAGLSNSEIVWPEENMFNFELNLLTTLKKLRSLTGVPNDEIYTLESEELNNLVATFGSDFESISIENPLPPGHKIKLIGNPNLGIIKGITVGVRNIDEGNDSHCGEVWINELRLVGLQERGGVAGLAQLDIQLADLGSITAATNYTSIGFGALDQRVNERAKEAVLDYDVSTNLALGKFFPDKWGIKLPFYGQYAKSITSPEFDAYDLDVSVDDKIDLVSQSPDRIALENEIKAINSEVNTIKTFNFTNVRKERVSSKSKPNNGSRNKGNNKSASPKDPNEKTKKEKKQRKPMPWNIENFSASYAYTEIDYKDAIIEFDKSKDYNLGLDYNFSSKSDYIKPFKKIKSKHLKFIKEFNFNLIPNSIGFGSNINRFVSTRRYRVPETPIYEFDDRRFDWQRRYDLNWNFAKSIKFNFSATNESYIDELRQIGIEENPDDRVWVNQLKDTISNVTADSARSYWRDNLKSGGRNTNYTHNASLNWTVPIKYLPFLDWVDVKAQYRTDYSWSAGALIQDNFGFDLPGVIQNGQSRSLTANLSFDKLYKKSKYASKLEKARAGKKKKTSRTNKSKNDRVTVSKDKEGKQVSRKNERDISTVERLLLRPFFMLRSARLTYKEDFTTVIPGFTLAPKYLGLTNDFSAPGLGFVFGSQPDISADNPDNYLDASAAKGWITQSPGLNQEVIQTKAQNIQAKFKLEPWKSFKVDIEFTKNYRTSHSEEFKAGKDINDVTFNHIARRDVGSFDISYFNMNTLFNRDIDELFDVFENNRSTISYRLPNENGEGPIDSHLEDGVLYAEGYGKQSSAVLVPAFLAAYTNQDANEIELDLEESIRSRSYVPKPNWNLRYDGLSKTPWFKDRFSSFLIEHGYSSKLRVNNFNSDVEYNSSDPYSNLRENGNYYTRVEVPSIQISEQFNPIIGVKMKTKGDMNLEFAYKKSRDLQLSINTSSELQEDVQEGYVFGFGYTWKDSKFLKKKAKKRTRSRTTQVSDKDKDDKDKDAQTGRSSRSKVNSTRGSDITLMVNFSFNDNISYVHRLDLQTKSDATRGSRSWQFQPSADYILNENVTIRMFFDYNRNRPYGVNPYPTTNYSGGFVFRMTLK